jgi:two-component system sensor kinase FixL
MSDPDTPEPRREPRDATLSAELSRATVANARDAIITIDTTGCIVRHNRAAEVMFGYSAEQLQGANVAMLMPPPYREEHDGYIRAYERTGNRRAIGAIRDVKARRRDGGDFPIELSVSALPLNGQRFYTAIIRDVTEYRAATEALRMERDFSRRLVEAIPIIIMVLDREAHILRVNRAMEEFSGWTQAEVRGRTCFELFIPEREHERISGLFDRAANGAGLRGIRVAVHTRTGTERLVEWYSEPLRDADERIIGVVCAGEDVTDRERAAREMRRLESLARERERLADLGAIAAKIVHDLGNPLSGMSMQAQLLLRRLESGGGQVSEKLEQPARRILAAVERMAELIRGFMDFAREKRVELARLDLVDLLEDVVGMWEPVAAGQGVALVLEASGTVPLLADPDKLRRVFDNLVRNAVEAIEGGRGNVEVRILVPLPGKAVVEVHDDGPGIAEGTDVFRLFETTKASGTGIGLAVAKQLVLAHAGAIRHSRSPLGGTCFSVELPADGPLG